VAVADGELGDGLDSAVDVASGDAVGALTVTLAGTVAVVGT
jgi:hypothetical protein